MIGLLTLIFSVVSELSLTRSQRSAPTSTERMRRVCGRCSRTGRRESLSRRFSTLCPYAVSLFNSGDAEKCTNAAPIQYGCNPTGMTSTLERRLQVLELARQHNFLILEGTSANIPPPPLGSSFDSYLLADDPYYYLYFGDAPRPPSYFTLERDQPEVGRVVRFDSLSKVLSSGMRIGFISAPQCIVDAVVLHVCGPFPAVLLHCYGAYAHLRTVDYDIEPAASDTDAGARATAPARVGVRRAACARLPRRAVLPREAGRL